MRNPEVQLWVYTCGVATLAGEPEQLPGFDADARRNPLGDGRKMRAVVAHTVVADDRDEESALSLFAPVVGQRSSGLTTSTTPLVTARNSLPVGQEMSALRLKTTESAFPKEPLLDMIVKAEA